MRSLAKLGLDPTKLDVRLGTTGSDEGGVSDHCAGDTLDARRYQLTIAVVTYARKLANESCFFRVEDPDLFGPRFGVLGRAAGSRTLWR
jgi:hypothetical protein